MNTNTNQLMSAASWTKPSRCGPTGDNCVEINLGPRIVGVRDSKAGAQEFLAFTSGAWAAFLAKHCPIS